MDWQDAQSTLLQPLTQLSRTGLVTDMDGTISPIVEKPDQAQVSPRNRELLQALQSHLHLVAIVSGRAVHDVYARVGLPDLVYVGNHGLERWSAGQVILTPEARKFRPALQEVLPDLQRQLLPGMRIEDKGVTISVHYRQSTDPQATERTFRPIVQQLATRCGLRVFSGRMVFELRPPVDINKGSILRNLVTEYRLEAVIFLGDDTTDVDALRMARQLREAGICHALGVGVLSADMPDGLRDQADLWVYGISDVEDFLAWLLNARKASSNCV